MQRVARKVKSAHLSKEEEAKYHQVFRLGDEDRTRRIDHSDNRPWKKIPPQVRKMRLEKGLIIVATSDSDGIPNASPRTAYWILDDTDTIAICEWFRHKTYWNLQKNNHVSISVIDLESLTGWQLKGYCELVTEPTEIKEISRKVMTETPHANFNRTMQLLGGSLPIIVKFKTQEIYSLAPEEEVPSINWIRK